MECARTTRTDQTQPRPSAETRRDARSPLKNFKMFPRSPPAPTGVLIIALVPLLLLPNVALTSRATTAPTTSTTTGPPEPTSGGRPQSPSPSPSSSLTARSAHNELPIRTELNSRFSTSTSTSSPSPTPTSSLALDTLIAASMQTNTASSSAPTRAPARDRQGSASLLRPSFIRGLLSPHRRRPSGQEAGSEQGQEQEQEDEEEEVTQTIEVPTSAEYEAPEKHQQPQGLIVLTSGRSRRLRPRPSSSGSARDEPPATIKAFASGSSVQPSAEASLRLTSTEIGGLLNDREAPEFYRERELSGDGVLLGEEPPGRATDSGRLGMAASGPFGSQFMGDVGGGVGGFDSGADNAAALYRHRLAQAASAEAAAYGAGGLGFNHRFGQQAFGSGGGGGNDELGGPGAPYGAGGGLMQSPNEYSEVNNFGGGGGGGAFMGGSQQQYQQQQQQHFGEGGADFSPHSGLLRAGSEGAYGQGGLGMLGGGGGGLGEFSGHGGVSEFSGGPSSFFNGASEGAGRLQAHASFNPYMQSGPAGEAAAAAAAEYASRFGQHQNGGGLLGGSPNFGFDQRGFASQNQFVSQRLHGSASGQAQAQAQAQAQGKLMPFTPVVPLADELAAAGVTQPSVLSSNQREVSAHSTSAFMGQPGDGGGGGALGRQQSRAPALPSQQVHEALEEDPTDVSSADEPVLSEHQQRQLALKQHYEGGGGGGGGGSNDADESQEGTLATTMSSSPQDPFVSRQTGNGEHSLILNVPPPQVDRQQADSGGSSSSSGGGGGGGGRTPMIEFSRVGSAGYLGPNLSLSQSRRDRHQVLATKKLGHHQQRRPQQQLFAHSLADQSDEGTGDAEEPLESDTRSAGADNPAHAGKYIID